MNKSVKFLTLVLAGAIIFSGTSFLSSDFCAKTVQAGGSSDGEDEFLEMYAVSFHWDLEFPDAEVTSWYEGPRWYDPELGWVMKPEKAFVQIDLIEDVSEDVILQLDTWLKIEYFLWMLYNPYTGTTQQHNYDTTDELTISVSNQKNIFLNRNPGYTDPVIYSRNDMSLPLYKDNLINDYVQAKYLSAMPIENIDNFEEMDYIPTQPVVGPVEIEETEMVQTQPNMQILGCGGQEDFVEDEIVDDSPSSKGIWYDLWTDESNIFVDGKKLDYQRYNLHLDLNKDPEDYITHWYTLSDLNPDENIPEEDDITCYGWGIADDDSHNIKIKTDGYTDGFYESTFYYKWMLLIPQIEYVSITVRYNYVSGEDDSTNPQESEDINPGKDAHDDLTYGEPAENQEDLPEEKDTINDNGEENPRDIYSIFDAFKNREISILEAILEIFKLFGQ